MEKSSTSSAFWGQQQRVAIGRALITSPPIVLADEPTGNLDFNTSNDILRVLVDMKQRFNQSMILVTHDPHIATYADRVLFFHDGENVDDYTCTHGVNDMNIILDKFKNYWRNQNDKISTRIKFTLFKTNKFTAISSS